MTAPAIPAPAVDTSNPSTGDTVGDLIASISRDAVAQTVAESDAAEDKPRGPDGRFLPKEGTETPAPTQPAVAKADATGEVEPVEGAEDTDEEAYTLPEGLVAVPVIEGRPLAMPFKVADKEGELEPPDLTITFTANGKERSEPLDKVVQLASLGVYNHEREQKTAQATQHANQVVQENQRLQAHAQQLEQYLTRVLSSDDAYLAARAERDAMNTPQAQAERARQDVESARQEAEFTRAAFQGETFFEREVQPAVQALQQALNTVSEDEIVARLLIASERFKVHTPFGTIIPPNQFDAFRQIVLQEVVPWAQQVHDARTHERKVSQQQTKQEVQATKAAATKAVTAAQIEAQKAKTLVGRATKPLGRQGATGKDTPRPKPITSIDEAMDAALKDTLASVGAA